MPRYAYEKPRSCLGIKARNPPHFSANFQGGTGWHTIINGMVIGWESILLGIFVHHQMLYHLVTATPVGGYH